VRTYTFAYDASPTPGVLGYRFYIGTVPGGPYNAPGSPKDFGNNLEGTYDVLFEATYYYVVRPYDSNGEGLSSPEASSFLLSNTPSPTATISLGGFTSPRMNLGITTRSAVKI